MRITYLFLFEFLFLLIPFLYLNIYTDLMACPQGYIGHFKAFPKKKDKISLVYLAVESQYKCLTLNKLCILFISWISQCIVVYIIDLEKHWKPVFSSSMLASDGYEHLSFFLCKSWHLGHRLIWGLVIFQKFYLIKIFTYSEKQLNFK